MTEDMAKRTQQYIQVRDKLKAMDEAHDKLRRPLVEIQEQLSGIISAFMETNKLENLKTEHGTCYTSVRYTASLADPALFMRYVIDHAKFELLDRRANSTAVKDFVHDTGGLPPGCNLNAIQTVGVRRPTGAGKKDTSGE